MMTYFKVSLSTCNWDRAFIKPDAPLADVIKQLCGNALRPNDGDIKGMIAPNDVTGDEEE